MMLIRVVRMRFRQDAVEDFRALFTERKATIASFDGCQHLELWQDAADPTVFCTYSHWDSEAHLNRYRFSEFFKDTWMLTRALFADKAVAWSAVRVD
jgi:quinol monooxygenase YgiN